MRQQAKDLSNRSRYLWTDLLEASDILAGRNLRSGAQIIGQFIEQGFSTRSAAVPLPTAHHTRRSLVTHYHPLSAITPYAKGSRSKSVLTNTGGWVVSAT